MQAARYVVGTAHEREIWRYNARWNALVFYVTALAAMFLMMFFKFWPLEKAPAPAVN